jgi:hypothetical protein
MALAASGATTPTLRQGAEARDRSTDLPRPARRSRASTCDVARVFAERCRARSARPTSRRRSTRSARRRGQGDLAVRAGPAGDDAHAAALDRDARAHGDRCRSARTVKPIAREQVIGPERRRGRGRRRASCSRRRSTRRGRGAKPGSGAAFGPYQFVPRTWVSLFKRRYPNDTRSFDEIAALRGDPHLQRRADQRPDQRECAALRHAGFEENAGNLYLAHVLGHDRAVTVLRAAPDAKLGDLLPHDYFKGNPFRPTDSAEPGPLGLWQDGRQRACRSISPRRGRAQGAEAIAPARRPAGRCSRRPGGSTSRRCTATSDDRPPGASTRAVRQPRGACRRAARFERESDMPPTASRR